MEDMTAIDRGEYLKRMNEEIKSKKKEHDAIAAKLRARAKSARRK